MNILFLTLARIDNVEQQGIYQDLLRKFRDNGHEITIVCPKERRYQEKTKFFESKGVKILNVWTTNFQKTNIIEKGFTTLLIEYFFLFAIRKFINYKNIDLILYSTPPITFTNLIKRLKKVSNAYTYLLLKDIFPQNAVDLKMMKPKGIFYKYFRRKEILLYKISDYIGCMSPENVKYLLKNNPQIDAQKIEVNPNAIDVNFRIIRESIDYDLFEKYGIPKDKLIFLFGGNLGLPQGIEYLKQNIKYCNSLTDVFFLIVGDGTEYEKLKKWYKKEDIVNACLIKELPKSEFDRLIGLADVGLIFLNPLFTIPNFPSRILSYMQNKLPVICATDQVTDIGNIASLNNFGYQCLASDSELFFNHVVTLLNKDLRNEMGENALRFLKKEYSTDISYNIIINKFLV